MATPTPTPLPSTAPVGEVCLPVVNCLPVSGGISEGGYIVLLLLVAIIVVGIGVLALFWRYGAVILKNVQEAKAEAKAAKTQVQNSHDTNLRDNIDANDEKSHEKLNTIVTELQSIRADMTTRFDGVNERISGIDARVTGIDVRLNSRSGTISGKEV